MFGIVKTIVRERGFGFVRVDDGSEFFFHRACCQPTRQEFDYLVEGDRVEVETENSPKGPRCASLRRM